jgi:chromatin assembly factor 1 subunit A
MEKFEAVDDVEYDLSSPENVSSFPKVAATRRTRRQQLPVEEIFNLLQGTSRNPIDLTSTSTQEEYALQLLEETPMKYLHFEEDVRPPYFGTWTKALTPQQWRHLARQPGYNLDFLDYDYDSEAEWEEPEEGEDLVSEDGEEEEDGEDDMDGFVDDADVSGPAVNRGFGKNDLIPVCSGLQWEDEKGNLNPADGTEKVDFSEFTMEFFVGMCLQAIVCNMLILADLATIDPFSTEYWKSDESPTKTKTLGPQSGTSRPALMDKTKQTNGVVPSPSTLLKKPRMVPTDELDQFKAAIVDQDLTKVAMIEHLKKMYVVPVSSRDGH